MSRIRGKLHLRLFALLLVSVLVAAACSSGGDSPGTDDSGPDAAAGEPTKGGTLVIGRNSDTAGLDPQTLINGEDMMIKRLLFAPLMDISSDGSGVEEALAESVEYDEENLAYTITLREANFSDGSPITSADAKFSLEHAAEGGFYGALFSKIDTMDTPDDQTLVVNLKTFDSLFLPGLAFGYVIPKDFGGQEAEAFFEDPVSSGPFVLESWAPGDEMVLARNSEYYDPERPYVDKVEYRIIPDANQKLVALQNGDIDVYEFLPHQLAQSLPEEQVYEVNPTSRVLLITVNSSKPPLDDIEVRRAMGQAINRDAMVEGIWQGRGESATGIVQPGIPDQVPGLETEWTYDPEAAKETLANSSYDNEPIELLSPNEREVEANVTQSVQSDLTAAGFKIKLETPDYGAAIDALVAMEFQTFMLGNGGYLPTAGEALLFYATVFSPLSAWPDPDTANALFEDYRVAETTEDREAAVAAFEDYVYETQAIIPIANPHLLYGVGERVGGFESTPGGLTMPDRMWVEGE
ncbi:MAG: peptide/nickel transport system substrate-binding protein [Actinomycetota bacterium]|nr:peptide/nickel transport system substrate-binding protein [Actinomycetota bacterium]